MKFANILASALFLTLLLGGTSEGKTSSRRSPKDLNIKEPLVALKTAYDNFISDFDTKIINIISLVIKLVPCILQALIPPSSSSYAITSIAHDVDFNLPLNDSQLELIAEKVASLPLPSINFQRSADPLCKTELFKPIHDFMWTEDKQLTDLVHFFGKFGYADIYDTIDTAYDACPELKDDLPKRPAADSKTKANIQVNGSTRLPNVREQLLQFRNSPRQDEPKCDILDIIVTLPTTGLIELVQLFGTFTKQFNTNPSLHFLVGKLQEPVKGISARKFREIEQVKMLLVMMHEELLKNEKWQDFFMVIKQLIGLDFTVVNPYEFMYTIVEFLVWGTPFPG